MDTLVAHKAVAADRQNGRGFHGRNTEAVKAEVRGVEHIGG